METQVESLKSSGGIVQFPHPSILQRAARVHPGPTCAKLYACIQSKQQKRGDRWRKMCKADNMAFCPWWCNVGLPGKRGEEPGLWFLLERRARFSYSCLCSIVSPPTHSASGQDLQRHVCLGAWWQPHLWALQHSGGHRLWKIKASIMWGTCHIARAGLVSDIGLETTETRSWQGF